MNNIPLPIKMLSVCSVDISKLTNLQFSYEAFAQFDFTITEATWGSYTPSRKSQDQDVKFKLRPQNPLGKV